MTLVISSTARKSAATGCQVQPAGNEREVRYTALPIVAQMQSMRAMIPAGVTWLSGRAWWLRLLLFFSSCWGGPCHKAWRVGCEAVAKCGVAGRAPAADGELQRVSQLTV